MIALLILSFSLVYCMSKTPIFCYQVCITDLDSHHGTFVMTRESFLSAPHDASPSGFYFDGGSKLKDKEDRLYKRVKPFMRHRLQDGDEIRFGKDVFRDNVVC